MLESLFKTLLGKPHSHIVRFHKLINNFAFTGYVTNFLENHNNMFCCNISETLQINYFIKYSQIF